LATRADALFLPARPITTFQRCPQLSTLFLVCAIIGGTVLVLQLVLGLIGIGTDTLDFGGDPSAGSDALHLLSARSIAAAFGFFGIAGLAALALGAPPVIAPLPALLAGGGAAVGTALLLRGLGRLEDDGTVVLERALGEPATVYLRIPGNNAGSGRVLLTLQDRTVECEAVTALDELPTGTAVIVVDIVGPGTVEVAPVPSLGGLLDVPS
jgi:hypothetical protein